MEQVAPTTHQRIERENIMGANRRLRITPHQHASKFAGQSCFICKAPANRKSKVVQKDKTNTALACGCCISTHNLTVA